MNMYATIRFCAIALSSSILLTLVSCNKHETELEALALEKQLIAMTPGEEAYVKLIPIPANANIADLKWTSSNPSVAKVDGGKVSAFSDGKAEITATALNGLNVSCTVSVIPADHEFVDLGLSVVWATCNLGAATSTEYGDYYAWGETDYHYVDGDAQKGLDASWKEGKSGYSRETYNYYFYSKYYLDFLITKYYTSTSDAWGHVDEKTMLEPTDDAAHVNWGSGWRMPTEQEWLDLKNYCTWTWTEINGVSGYKVQSNKPGYKSNFIFLPAAGSRLYNSNLRAGEHGDYWVSEVDKKHSGRAKNMLLREDEFYMGTSLREEGCTIRPVFE